MARTIRDAKLDTRSARIKLQQRREPYWTVISEGCALGYRRGAKGGTWIGRYRDEVGKQHYAPLGAADDARDPDNVTVFSFAQAQANARIFFEQKVREISGDFIPNAKFTVGDALKAYKEKYVLRGGKDIGRFNSAGRAYILPAFVDVPVAKLTRARLEKWHHEIATSPPRVRGRKGQNPKIRAAAPKTAEETRRRAASANRVLTILKAALNAAFNDGHIRTNEAWSRVKAFRKVDAARIRYLSDDEARRLVRVCPADFKLLVIAGLLTGCRYSELANLTVEDFDAQSSILLIRMSKSGKPRRVVLTTEGADFFREQKLEKRAEQLFFTKLSGSAWSTADQQRRMVAAWTAAEIEPVTFHGLRHTYASRLAMKNVPLAVIAAQLGHADVRMVEKHYGHLAPNYVADTVRAAFTSMDLCEPRTPYQATAAWPASAKEGTRLARSLSNGSIVPKLFQI